MPRRIVFTGKGQVAVHEFVREPVGAGQVRLRAVCSLISTGTENICLHRLFAPGTHWDQWVSSYPFATGYSMVGVVEEVGEGVSADLVGTRVVSRVAHASEAVTSAGHVYPYPPEIPAEQAAWFALGMIGFMGAKAGGFGIGHEVLVVGGGPIGQMAVRWAAACGAETIGLLDPVPMRLMLGTAGGANRLLELVAEGAAEDVREAFGGELPGTVVDATGHAAVFEHCLALPRRLGKLVLLGDTGDPSQQRLTPDVVRRGIQVHGAHVTHEEGEWTEGRIHRLFFELIRAGRFPLQNLITHRFAPEQAPEAYELTTTRRSETMGVLFDWGYGS